MARERRATVERLAPRMPQQVRNNIETAGRPAVSSSGLLKCCSGRPAARGKAHPSQHASCSPLGLGQMAPASCPMASSPGIGRYFAAARPSSPAASHTAGLAGCGWTEHAIGFRATWRSGPGQCTHGREPLSLAFLRPFLFFRPLSSARSGAERPLANACDGGTSPDRSEAPITPEIRTAIESGGPGCPLRLGSARHSRRRQAHR